MSDLPAGRELDALVAEKVMGWRRSTASIPQSNDWWVSKDFIGLVKLSDFSTTWEGMRLVVERMRELGWMYTLADCVGVWAVFMSGELGAVRQKGSTLPHAVCLAALAAMEEQPK